MNELSNINSTVEKRSCFHCDSVNNIYQPEDCIIYACPVCLRIDGKIGNKSYRSLKNNWKNNYASLKLHAVGNFNGKTITIIGIAYKKGFSLPWTEYQTIDEDNNLHIFSECKGHFHYLKYIPVEDEYYKASRIVVSKNLRSFTIEDHTFERYENSYNKTQAIIGEFSYNVIDIKEILCADYICPPYLITAETHKDGKVDLFSGYYVSLEKMREIFPDQTFRYPDSSILGLAQPIFFGLDKKKINKYGLYGVCILIFLFIVFKISSSETLIDSVAFKTTVDDKDYISNSFTLDEGLGDHYLTFTGDSPSVDNEWIENQITLVNEKTGEERELSLGIEYYSGVEDGYSWSEGSTVSEVSLANVKPGKYHIKSSFVSANPYRNLSFNMEVYDSSPLNWNFGVLIVIFGGLIVIFNFTYNNIEEKR